MNKILILVGVIIAVLVIWAWFEISIEMEKEAKRLKEAADADKPYESYPFDWREDAALHGMIISKADPDAPRYDWKKHPIVGQSFEEAETRLLADMAPRVVFDPSFEAKITPLRNDIPKRAFPHLTAGLEEGAKINPLHPGQVVHADGSVTWADGSFMIPPIPVHELQEFQEGFKAFWLDMTQTFPHLLQFASAEALAHDAFLAGWRMGEENATT